MVKNLLKNLSITLIHFILLLNLRQTAQKKKVNIFDIGVTLKNGVLTTDLFVKSIDTHQFLHPASCHSFHCKKGIPYCQTLRVKGICSDDSNFDKQCNELKSLLFGKSYSEKIVRKQVLRDREHSRESLLKNVKTESNQKKLTFNITYYPVFQNVRNILQELHILLILDQEHKKVFQNIPVARFRKSKGLKDNLVRAKIPNVEITGMPESCGKGNCQVCDLICDTDIFTTKACGETFKLSESRLSFKMQNIW